MNPSRALVDNKKNPKVHITWTLCLLPCLPLGTAPVVLGPPAAATPPAPCLEPPPPPAAALGPATWRGGITLRSYFFYTIEHIRYLGQCMDGRSSFTSVPLYQYHEVITHLEHNMVPTLLWRYLPLILMVSGAISIPYLQYCFTSIALPRSGITAQFQGLCSSLIC